MTGPQTNALWQHCLADRLPGYEKKRRGRDSTVHQPSFCVDKFSTSAFALGSIEAVVSHQGNQLYAECAVRFCVAEPSLVMMGTSVAFLWSAVCGLVARSLVPNLNLFQIVLISNFLQVARRRRRHRAPWKRVTLHTPNHHPHLSLITKDDHVYGTDRAILRTSSPTCVKRKMHFFNLIESDSFFFFLHLVSFFVSPTSCSALVPHQDHMRSLRAMKTWYPSMRFVEWKNCWE